MTVWQKISGTVATIGASGSAVLQHITGLRSSERDAAEPDLGTSFTIAMIALAAKMAKADGVVSAVEVETFNRLVKTPPAEAANVERLFRLAQQDVAGFEAYADQIRHLLRDDHRLLRDVLESLFHIASADRAIHPAEALFLETVAQHFGLSGSEYRHVRAHFVEDQSSPYDILGLDPAVSNEDLKTRHKRLVRENHPDLAIGRGVPREMVDAATRKLAAINGAYATICKERGL